MKIEDQPPPKAGGVPVWPLVIQDMRDRDQVGRQRYGTPLQASNGRDALVDAYQEALDLAVYMRQRIEEERWIPTEERLPEERTSSCLVTLRTGRVCVGTFYQRAEVLWLDAGCCILDVIAWKPLPAPYVGPMPRGE